MKLIRRNSLVKESWSGGSTTEIYLYPPKQSYKSRNFLWRLSEAIIEDEKTIFTKLDGFHRITLVLEGQLKLQHQDYEPIKLNTLEQNHYKGHWLTVSEGKVTNLNIIYDPSLTATLETIVVHRPYFEYTLYKSNSHGITVQHLLYTLAPVDVIFGNGMRYSLNKGETILFNEFIDSTTLEFHSQTNDIQFVHIRFEREIGF